MKQLLFAVLIFTTPDSFAGPAVGYSCVGKNSVENNAVVFSLLFGSCGLDGCQDQSISIEKIDGLKPRTPLRLQMAGAKSSNECKTNVNGETFFKSIFFEMSPTPKESLAAYLVSFKFNCDGQDKLFVQGYCFFEHE